MKSLGKILPALLFLAAFVLFATRNMESRSDPGTRPVLVSEEVEQAEHGGAEGPDDLLPGQSPGVGGWRLGHDHKDHGWRVHMDPAKPGNSERYQRHLHAQ